MPPSEPRILIIDDKRSIHEDFRKVLVGRTSAKAAALDELEGLLLGSKAPVTEPKRPRFDITSAYSGKEGLEAVETSLFEGRPFSMMFVDMRMPPGWDGLETIQRIWRICPEIEGVICTAYSDHSWSTIVDALGVTDRLLRLKKPFDPVEVQQFALALCEKARLAKSTRFQVNDLEASVQKQTRLFELVSGAARASNECSRPEDAAEVILPAMVDAGPFNAGAAVVRVDAEPVLIGTWTPDPGRRDELVGWLTTALTNIVRRDEAVTWVDLEGLKPIPQNAHALVITRPVADGISLSVVLLAPVASPVPPGLEQALAAAADQLAHNVDRCQTTRRSKAMMGELGEARDAADRASQAKSEFLANMSHEIRTPLNAVLGLTELVLCSDLQPEQKASLEIVHRSATSLTSLLNDILDLSKIESGQLEICTEATELLPFVYDVADNFYAAAHKKGVELVVSMTQDVPRVVEIDAAPVRQILVNLVGNAVKFTSKGHVEISVRTQARDALVFVVEDTGVGIADDRKRAVFDRFVQADGSTTRRFGGSGLGLAISRKLTNAIGGSLTLETELGQGSAFALEIPLRTIESAVGDDRRLPVAGLAVAIDVRSVVLRRALVKIVERIGGLVVDRADKDVVTIGEARVGRRANGAMHLRVEHNTSSVQLHKPVRPRTMVQALHDLRSPSRRRSAPARMHDPVVACRVLLVEDNAVNRLVASRMLVRIGCDVAVAEDGAEALLALEQNSFDLVFMDCEMPTMDGYETTQRIRAGASVNPDVPIVALTANAISGDRERCLQVGMNDFVTKPVSIARLRKAVEAWTMPESSTVDCIPPVPEDLKSSDLETAPDAP